MPKPTETTANILFKGKETDFLKTLEKSVSSTKDLKNNTGLVNKSFIEFNKTAKKSDGLLKSIAGSSLDTAKGFTLFTKNSIGFGKSTVTNSERLIGLNDALYESTSGLSGFGLKLLGVRDDIDDFNYVLDGPAGHLRDIADAATGTERAFIILDKAEKPLLSGLKLLDKGLDRTVSFFRVFEDVVESSTKKALSVGSAALEGLSNSLTLLQSNFKNNGFIGKIIASQLGGVGKTIEQVKEKSDLLATTLTPANFKKADEVGNKLANVFEKSDKIIDRAALGIKAADLAGDVYRTGLSVREFVEDSLIPMGATIGAVVPKFFAMAKASQASNNAFVNAGNNANTLNKVIRNQIIKTLAEYALKIGKALTVTTFLSKAWKQIFVDLRLEINGVNDAFTTFQSLGIDTSAAEAALQFGILGENLLFNADASKQFGQAAVQAFSKMEDQIAFVTTLTAGTKASFQGLEQGAESIGVAINDLVSGPLKNAISAGEASTAMYNALSAGIGVAKDGTADLAKTNQFMEASLKLASSTGTDAAQTLEVLAKVSKVYGRSSSEASKTAAQLYGIVQEGITTFPQLAGGLGRTASVAQASGVQLEELSGSIAALSKVMTTDDALTGYSSLLAAIAGQGAQSAKTVAELGIKFDAQTVRSKGLVAALQDLAKATNGNQETLKKIIPDMLAFQTATQLMGSAGRDAASVMENITETGKNANEELNSLFDGRQDTIIQRSSNLMNGFNNILIEFGEKALPLLEPGLKFLEGVLNFFQELPEPVKKVVGTIILIQAGFGRVVTGITGVISLFAKLYIGLVANNFLMKSISGQIGEEIDSLSQLLLLEKDVVGFLTKAAGLSGKYSNAVRSITKAKEAQLKVDKELAKVESKNNGLKQGDIQIVDKLVESYTVGIQTVQKKLKELRKSDLNKVSPELFKETEKDYKRLLKALRDAESKTIASQTRAVSELKTNINKSIISTTNTIEEKKKDITSAVDSMFTVFGEAGDKIKEKLNPTIELVLADTTLTAKEKGEKISEKIREIGKDAPKSVQGNLKKLAETIRYSYSGIETVQEKFQARYRSNLENLLANTRISEKDKLKLSYSFRELFAGLEETAESRREKIKEAFDLTFKYLPQTVKDSVPGISNAVDSLLNDATRPLEARKNDFKKYMQKNLKGMDASIQVQAASLSQSMLNLVEGLETPIAALDVQYKDVTTQATKYLENFKAKTKTLVDKGLSRVTEKDFQDLKKTISYALQDTELTVEQKVALINDKFSTLGKNVSKESLEKLNKLKTSTLNTLEEIDSESYQLLQSGAKQLKAASKKSLEVIKEEYTSAKWEIDFALSKFDFRQRVADINEQVSNIGKDLPADVKENLDSILFDAKLAFSDSDIKKRIDLVNEQISRLGKEDKEVKENLEEVRDSLEAGLKDSRIKTLVENTNQKLSLLAEGASDKVKENVNLLRLTLFYATQSEEVEKEVKQVNEQLSLLGDTGTQEEVKTNLEKISQFTNQYLNKIGKTKITLNKGEETFSTSIEEIITKAKAKVDEGKPELRNKFKNLLSLFPQETKEAQLELELAMDQAIKESIEHPLETRGKETVKRFGEILSNAKVEVDENFKTLQLAMYLLSQEKEVKVAVEKTNVQLSLLGDPEEIKTESKLDRLKHLYEDTLTNIAQSEGVKKANEAIASIGQPKQLALNLYQTETILKKYTDKFSNFLNGVKFESEVMKIQFENTIEEVLDEGIENTLDQKKQILNKKLNTLLDKAPESVKSRGSEIKAYFESTLESIEKDIEESELAKRFDYLFSSMKGSVGDFADKALFDFKALWLDLEVPEEVKGKFESSIVEVSQAFEKLKKGEITLEEVQVIIKNKTIDINSEIEKISNSKTANKVKENLQKLETSADSEFTKLVATAKQKSKEFNEATENALEGTRKVKSGLRGLAMDLGGQMGLPVGQMMDLGEVMSGLGLQAKGASKEVSSLEAAQNLLSVSGRNNTKTMLTEIAAFKENRKEKGALNAVNAILTASTGVSIRNSIANTVAKNADTVATAANTVATNANAAASLKAGLAKAFQAKMTQLNTFLSGGLRKTFKFLVGAMKGGIALAKKFLVALGPILVVVGAITTAFGVIKTFFLDLIPGVNLLTNKYARLGASIKKVSKEIEELNNKDKKDTIEKKQYADSWTGRIAGGLGSVIETGVKAKRLLGLSKEDVLTEQKMVRSFFNDVKENIQAFNTREARKEINALTGELALLRQKANFIAEDQKKGIVNSDIAKEILERAKESSRALTSGEVAQVIEAEKAAANEQKKNLEDTLVILNERLDAAKKAGDPDIIAGIERETQAIQEQITVVEEGTRVIEKHINTLQTFSATVDLNDSAKGLENFIEKLETSINSEEFQKLPDNLKNTFKELQEVSTQTINLKDPEMSKEEILEATGLTEEVLDEMIENGETSVEIVDDVNKNLVNAIQRRTAAASNVAAQNALSLAVNIADPDIDINSDQAETTIQDAIEAYQNELDQGVISQEQYEVKRKVLLQTEFVIPEGEVGDLANNLRGKTYEDILSASAKEEIFNQEIEIIQNAANREIKIETQKIEQIEALRKSGDLTSLEAAEQTAEAQAEISRIELQTKKDILDENIEYYGYTSRQVKEFTREMTTFERQEDAKRIEAAKNLSKERIAARNVYTEHLKSSQSDINAQLAKGELNRVEALQRTQEIEAQIDAQTIANKQDTLNTLLSLQDANSEEVKAAQLDLYQTQRDIEIKRIKERKDLLDAELDLIKEKFEIEKQLAQNQITEDSNATDLRRKVISLETKAIQSNLSLSKQYNSFEETMLSNRAKLTGDIVEKAEINLEIQKNKQVLLNKELEAEETNLLFNQELVALGFEREKSQLRMNKLQAENLKKTLELRLSKKDELKLTETEVSLLEAQVAEQTLALEFADSSAQHLEDQIARQEQINANELEALNLRREAAVQSQAVEVELATRERIVATYEKEKQQVLLRNEIESVGNQSRIQSLEQASSLLSSQLDLMSEQKGLVDSMMSSIQTSFNLALQSERNEYRKRRLQKEAAELQLETLKRQQEYEKFSYELQVQQKDLALERKTIEIEIAKAKAEADLAVAKADQQIIEADSSKSQLEKEAAAARTRAAEIGLAGLDQQSALVNRQREIELSTRGLEREQFERGQRDALLQQRASVASFTLRRSDDRLIGREALDNARRDAQELPQLFNELNSNLAQLVNIDPNSTVGSGFVNSSNSGIKQRPQKLEGRINLDLNLSVEGNTEGINKESLEEKISQGVNNSFDSLFNELLTRSKA